MPKLRHKRDNGKVTVKDVEKEILKCEKCGEVKKNEVVVDLPITVEVMCDYSGPKYKTVSLLEYKGLYKKLGSNYGLTWYVVSSGKVKYFDSDKQRWKYSSIRNLIFSKV